MTKSAGIPAFFQVICRGFSLKVSAFIQSSGHNVGKHKNKRREADLLIVGKYAFAQDVSGVAVGSQMMQTITSLVSSFAMGTTIEELKIVPVKI